MLDILFFFALIFGPLVLVHELGHFIAARAFGVKVHEFAIGFGPALFRITRGETEYSLRAIPAGGYVLMLGMGDEVSDDDSERGRSLVEKKIWQRMIISLAGPAMNVLVAIPVYMLAAGLVAERPAPVIGYVAADSAAERAGLLPGDEIIGIDGKEVRWFDDVSRYVEGRAGETLTVQWRRHDQEMEAQVTPDAVPRRAGLLAVGVVERGQLGVGLLRPAAIVHVPPDSDAASLGFQTFDRVRAVDGQRITAFDDLRDALRPGARDIEIERQRMLPDAFAALYTVDPVRLRVEIPAHATLESLGLTPAHATLRHVIPGSPADEAGLRAGDRLLRVDDHAVNDVLTAISRIETRTDAPWTLQIERDGVILAVELTPEERRVLGEFRSEQDEVFVGIAGLDRSGSWVAPTMRAVPWGRRIRDAVVAGFVEPIAMIGLIIGSVLFMIFGKLDTSNLGGPMMIADVAARAGAMGWIPFLKVAAAISLNLGTLNLMPVPGLDGGTMSILTWEAITRRPITPRARQMLQYIGFASIVALMLLVFWNDLQRYWVDIANWLNA